MERSKRGDWMSQGNLRTSEDKVRELHEKLHRSAKRDKARRFHQLYDKVASAWFVEVAWRRVKANKSNACATESGRL